MVVNRNHFNDLCLVITSSGRSDLLAKTLVSMNPWIDHIEEKILIEDGNFGHEAIANIANQYGFTYLENEAHIGQHRSIDQAYQYVTKPYIFHCEDDWQFYKQPDFDLATEILDQPKISCVCFRKINDRSRSKYPNRTLDINRYQAKSIHNKSYLVLRSDWHSDHGAFTFNPNLIKTQLYNSIKPYQQFATERAISVRLKSHGYKLAFEPQGSCIHIGWNRHVQDPTKLPRAYTFFGRLRRSYKKRLKLAKNLLAKVHFHDIH